MQKKEKITTEKDISFEVMRTLACFFVVAIHVFSKYFSLFNKISLKSWFFATTIESLSRFSVPLFIMISGALLLRKNISTYESLRKAVKFLFALIIWSFAYVVISRICIYKETLTLQQVTIMFFSNKIYYHLWYLYMLIGLYLIIPFIRNFIGNEELKLYIIIFLSFSFIKIIPVVLTTIFSLNIPIYLEVPLMDWQLGCLFLGYYIGNLKINKKKIILSIIGLVAINIITVILTYLESLKNNKSMETYFGSSKINIILMAVCVFIIIKYISRYISTQSLFGKIFFFIGSISFEVYLIHPMILSFYEEVIQKYIIALKPKLGIRYVFELLLVFSLSVITAYLINVIVCSFRKSKKLSNKYSSMT